MRVGTGWPVRSGGSALQPGCRESLPPCPERPVSTCLRSQDPLCSPPLSTCRVSPQVGFQDAVQALVERPGGVIACPVMVLPVRIGEEISTQHRKPWRPGPWLHARPLVQGIEVVGESAKLGLWGPPNHSPQCQSLLGTVAQGCSQAGGRDTATQSRSFLPPGPHAPAGSLGRNSDGKGKPAKGQE